jgi:hypothetical protein
MKKRVGESEVDVVGWRRESGGDERWERDRRLQQPAAAVVA